VVLFPICECLMRGPSFLFCLVAVDCRPSACRSQGMQFVSYEPQRNNGTWVFKVKHFSRYSLQAVFQWKQVPCCGSPCAV
jgi:hypothetical protein